MSMAGHAVIVFVYRHFVLDLFLPSAVRVLGSRAGRVAGVGSRIHVFDASAAHDAGTRLEEFIQLHRLVASRFWSCHFRKFYRRLTMRRSQRPDARQFVFRASLAGLGSAILLGDATHHDLRAFDQSTECITSGSTSSHGTAFVVSPLL
jgi:hypothetical protein